MKLMMNNSMHIDVPKCVLEMQLEFTVHDLSNASDCLAHRLFIYTCISDDTLRCTFDIYHTIPIQNRKLLMTYHDVLPEATTMMLK